MSRLFCVKITDRQISLHVAENIFATAAPTQNLEAVILSVFMARW